MKTNLEKLISLFEKMSKSQIEELFGMISLIVGILFLSNNFYFLGWLFIIKGMAENIIAIIYAIKEIKNEM